MILCIIIAALKKSNTKVASVLKAMVQDLNLCANPWIAKTCSVQLLYIAVSLSTFSFFLSFPCLSDIWWRENGPCSSMQMRLSLKIMKYHSRWLFSDIIFKNYFLCNWFSVVSPSIFLLPLSVFSFPSWFWMERKCSWHQHAQKTIYYKTFEILSCFDLFFTELFWTKEFTT